jgi:hypothetical protein
VIEACDPTAPHLVFDWNPGGSDVDLSDAVAALAAEVTGAVEGALCSHPGGPPTARCRPPLPGLPLAFARKHAVDLSCAALVGTSPAHRTLATAIGAGYIST